MDKKKLIVPYVISFIVFATAFVSFYYWDTKSLTIWSTNIWDTLADTHNIRNYYEYSSYNIYGLEHQLVGSDMLVYLPHAIWNIPIWCIQRWGGVRIVDTPIMLLYSKLFWIFIFAGICVVIKKILAIDKKEASASLSIYLISSSIFFLYDIAYAGQNNLLVIFLYLSAIYALFKGKKGRFYLVASFSIAFKPFLFFAYIAVILLMQKKLHYILRDILLGVSVYILQKIPFVGAPMYKESLAYGPTNRIIGSMLEGVLNIGYTGFSILILSILAVFVLAYLTEVDSDSEQFRYQVVYYTMVPLMLQVIMTRDSFNRSIYFIVFMAMCIVYKNNQFRINLILEIAYSGCMVLYNLFSNVNFLLPRFLFWNDANNKNFFICDKLNSFFGYEWHVLFIATNTIGFFAMILYAIINHPRFESKAKVLNMKPESYLLYIRLLITLVPVLISMVL